LKVDTASGPALYGVIVGEFSSRCASDKEHHQQQHHADAKVLVREKQLELPVLFYQVARPSLHRKPRQIYPIRKSSFSFTPACIKPRNAMLMSGGATIVVATDMNTTTP
jgi:hypothetical protein